jgi:hypothetical protein
MVAMEALPTAPTMVAMDDHANRAPSRAMDGHDDHRVGAGRRAGPRRTAPQCVASHRTTSRIIAAIVAARCGQPRGDCPYAMRFIANRCGQSLFHVAGNHGGIAPTQRQPMCCGGATAQLASARVRCPCTTEQGSADAIWCLILPMRCSSALVRCPCATEECCAGTIGCSIRPCAVSCCVCAVSWNPNKNNSLAILYIRSY